MKHVRLTIRAPEGSLHPVFDMLTRGDHAESVLGLHWEFSGDRLSVLHYVEGDPDGYVGDLEAIDEVLDYDLARTGEGAFYVYHRCVLDHGAAKLFAAFDAGNLILVPPVEFGDDGASTFSLFGDGADVQAAIDDLPDGVGVTVEEIGGMSDTPGVDGATLSDRQREAAEAAIALGYYEVPREASHGDVAEALDCAPSTAAEHLRKAESKLLRSVLG